VDSHFRSKPRCPHLNCIYIRSKYLTYFILPNLWAQPYSDLNDVGATSVTHLKVIDAI
jgi:hypothetical protein